MSETGIQQKYRSKFEAVKQERDCLRQEVKELRKTLKTLRRKEKFDTKSREKLTEVISKLERKMEELPHIVLTTGKILSMIEYNRKDKRIFGRTPEETINKISIEFGLTTDQARDVWNFLLFYSGGKLHGY